MTLSHLTTSPEGLLATIWNALDDEANASELTTGREGLLVGILRAVDPASTETALDTSEAGLLAAILNALDEDADASALTWSPDELLIGILNAFDPDADASLLTMSAAEALAAIANVAGVSQAPIIADQGAPFGALTAAGAGGFAIVNTGDLLASATIDSGDASNHFDISIVAGVAYLIPTAGGATAYLNLGPYTLGITGTGVGGATDTATLTVTVEASVRSAGTGDLAAIIALGDTTIDGATVKGRPGADLCGATIGDTVTFAATEDYATGLVITSHDQANPCYLRRLVARHDGTVTLRDLVVRDYFTSGDSESTSLIRYKAGGASKIVMDGVEAYSDTVDSPTIDRLRIFYTDSGLSGLSLVVDDCYFHDFGRGISGKGYDILEIRTSIFDQAYQDMVHLNPVGTETSIIIRDNDFLRHYGLFTDSSGPHQDVIQIDMVSMTQDNVVPYVVVGNTFFPKDGRGYDQHCIFINQTLSPRKVLATIEHNMISSRHTHAITIEMPAAGTVIRGNTVVWDINHISLCPKINITDAQGACEVAYNACPDVTETGTAAANIHHNHEYGTASSDNDNTDYAALFAGTDFDTSNIASAAALRTALQPDVGGALDAAPGLGAGWYYNYTTHTANAPWDEDGYNVSGQFTDVTGATPSTATTSNEITLSGVSAIGALVRVSGGVSPTFRVRDGSNNLIRDFSSNPYVVPNGYKVALQDTAGGGGSTSNISVKVGSTTDTWTIAASTSYTAESEAIFAAFTTPPDTARKTAVDTLVTSLKSGGAWDLVDVLYVLAAADSQAAKINWKNPGALTASEVNSLTFTPDRGFAGNGTDSYLNTGYNPSTGSLGISQDSAHIGVYALGDAGGSAADVGYQVGTGLRVRGRSGVSAAAGVSSSTLTSAVSGGASSAPHHTMGIRRDSSSQLVFDNGTQNTSASVASTALSSQNIGIGKVNSSFSSRQIAAAHVGQALSDAQALALYNAIYAYMQTVGAAP